MAAGGRRARLTLLAVLATGPVSAVAQDAPVPTPPPPSPSKADRPTVRILPFGSADFTSRSEDSGHAGFSIGPFDLYVTARLSEHWSALGELVFENDDNELSTDLERFLVGWQASDRLRLRAGREHNPIVRWNTALHHGLYMQTPIERPSMARFEDDGGPWPVHFVGLFADGMAGPGIRYGAGVGNGRGAIPDEVQVTFDRNAAKAFVGWIGWSPPGVVGLELDLTGYADRVPAASGELRERAWTGSASYVGSRFELRGEYGRIEHRPGEGSDRFQTTGWYALAAYELPRVPLKPYLMLDHMTVAAEDPFFAGVPGREGWVIGLRWDPDPRAAIKGEVTAPRVGDGARDTIVRAQVAVAF